MTASRSSSASERRPGIGEALAGLGADERLAAIGAAIVAGSMFLPWYGVSFNRDLVTTGFGAFDFVSAAILLTVGTALAVIVQRARGVEIPTPLHEGTLLAAAGAWAAALVGYRMFLRPHFTLGGFEHAYEGRYGIVIALGGACLLAAAGLRRRRRELHPAAPAKKSPEPS